MTLKDLIGSKYSLNHLDKVEISGPKSLYDKSEVRVKLSYSSEGRSEEEGFTLRLPIVLPSTYYTIIELPFVGGVVEEHTTKEEAESQYIEDCKDVEADHFLGAALVRMEIVSEKGEWKI